MKYRMKPVIIEAIQWTGQNFDEIKKFAGDNVEIRNNELIIKTLEDGAFGQAIHAATPWDYIIKGINGEFYFCKPDIFDKTYEKCEQPTNYDETIKREG